jgi:hypothetical protein
MTIAPAQAPARRTPHVPGELGIWMFIAGGLVLFSLVAVIVITFVEVRFIVFEFMEIRGAPTWMHRVGDGWIVLIAGLLIGRVLIAASLQAV